MSLLQYGSNALINQAFQSDALLRQDLAFVSNASTAFGLNKNGSLVQALPNRSTTQAFRSNKNASSIQSFDNASTTQALQPNAKASVSFKTKNPLSLSLSLCFFRSKLIKRFAILIASLFLISCGSSGGSSSNGVTNNNNNPSVYTVSFYDSVLDFNGSIEIDSNSPTINLTQLRDELDLNATALYRASDSNDVLNLGSYTINGNTNFYAVPNVVEITNQAGLNLIRNNLSGKYILLNDIALTPIAGEDQDEFNQTYGWKPIGAEDGFTGILNGNNNRITGLWIDRTNSDDSYNIGLFSYVAGYYNEPIFAQIRNLGVEIAEGKAVRGDGVVGAIAGEIDDAIIFNSYSAGKVIGAERIGGIAGTIYDSSIIDSYSTATVDSENEEVGGIAGVIDRDSLIINSRYDGNVSGYWYVGGIAGQLDHSTIRDSYATGNISGGSEVGGIAGSISHNSSVTNSYFIGSVDGAFASYLGGIAGTINDGSITNSYAKGSVNGEYRVGGIAGEIDRNSFITNSYFIGSVTGTQETGGIAGAVIGGSITNSYATGAISGTNDIGGIVGNASRYTASAVDDPAKIQYNAAINLSVTGNSNVNRVVGGIDNIADTINNNFARSDLGTNFSDLVDGNAHSGTGITDNDDFLKQSLYEGLGWAFGSSDSAPWRIDEGVGYPYFYWQNQ
jgi:hypothetical protein